MNGEQSIRTTKTIRTGDLSYNGLFQRCTALEDILKELDQVCWNASFSKNQDLAQQYHALREEAQGLQEQLERERMIRILLGARLCLDRQKEGLLYVENDEDAAAEESQKEGAV